MAFLGGLLGGGSDPMDIYGDLFTPQQRAALRDQQMTQGLLNAAAVFSKAGQASRLPVSIPWGEAAQALGGSGDEAMNRMLKGMQVAEEVRGSRQTREWQTKLNQMLMPIWQKQMAMGQPLNPSPASVGATPPVAPGAPAGGPPASNAPPTPDTGVAPSSPLVPSQDLSRWGLPTRPGRTAQVDQYGNPPPPGYVFAPDGSMRALPTPPGEQTGLLGAPPAAAGQGEGLLAGMLPFGPDNQGSPDLSNIKIEPLSGEAAPAGDAGRQARVKFWTDQGAPQHVAEGIADRVKAESGFRSDAMGDQGTSGGLYQHHADRLARLKSFAAQQGTSWTDPNVQDRFAATEVKGGDAIAAKGWPAIVNAPDRQTAAMLWDKYFERSKYGPGAGGGGGFSGRVEPLGGEAAPAGAAPSGTIPGLGMTPEALATLNALMKVNKLGSPFDSLLETYYKSPGYLAEKARTEAQAAKDVALKMDPLIQTQTDIAKAKVDFEWKPKIEEAVQKLQSPILKEREQAKADIDRYSKELEQNRNAALTPTDATVLGPEGRIETQRITASEFARRQQARAERATRGDTTLQLGDIVGAPVGAPPAEHEYRMTPQGALTAVPVPGTPAAEKAAEVANKKLQGEQQKLIARDVVVREVDNIGKLMSSATLPTTGFTGSFLQNLGGTAANDVRIARQTLEARMSTDAINAMRAASPTGAALGNTSDTDMAILRTALVNLDQSQSKEQFQERLQILKQAYVDAVHGPGMSRLLPETPVLKAPSSTTAPAGPIDRATFDKLPSGSVFIAPDGSRRIKP